MNQKLIEEQHFKGLNFLEKPLEVADYDNCTFNNCVFANTDLSGFDFQECEFMNCDLSLAKLKNTAIKNCSFSQCKMLGLRFEDCHRFLLSMTFKNCQLNLSTFYQLDLKKTLFQGCSLHEVDFMEANLSGALFQDCDLTGAVFDHTNLEQADFRTSYGFTIDPENNRIKKARFSIGELAGLLGKYDILVE